MIHDGVIVFMLEKLGPALGISNLHIYAAMRGHRRAVRPVHWHPRATLNTRAAHRHEQRLLNRRSVRRVQRQNLVVTVATRAWWRH